MTTTVVLLSDLHANSKAGLCPPVVNLYSGGTYRAGRPQRWVYSRFLAFRDEVGEAQQRNGGRVILFLNGELADDNKHSKFDLVELHPDGQMSVAIDALMPLLELIDRERGDLIYVLRGTEAHSGPDSWMDNAIGRDIGAVVSAEEETRDGARTRIHSFYNLMASIDGVRFKGAHHPPVSPGRLPWTQGLFAQRLAAHVYYSAVRAKEPPPDVFFSGHFHVPGDSYDAFPTRALALPAWQLPTSFAYRLGADRPLPVGGVIVTCDRGKYEAVKHFYEWPIRRYEVV
jgi:hypothetical protein